MNIPIKSCLFAAVVAALSGLSFWSCNIGDSVDTTTLRLRLPDSLDAKFGKFDSVEINISDSQGNVTQAKIFSEPYNKDVDSARLANLQLTAPVPDPMTIHITAFKGTDRLWTYEISIVKGIATPKPAIYVGPEIQPPIDSINPTSIDLLIPTPMTLFPNGTPGDLIAQVKPEGSDQIILWTSSDTSIAIISSAGKVLPLKAGPTTITGKSRANPAITASFQANVILPVKVDAINILPKSLTLYTGGTEGKLTVSMTGSDSGAKYTLASSDIGVATVSAAGSVKGLTAGATAITATVVGYPAVTSVCSVQVVKDPPVVTVGPNRNVAFNDEAVFTVSVAPQAYGATVEIKADMDGDGIYEQTVLNRESAEFKQKYSEVKITTISFKVKDTEGNEETVTRKVTVGAPGTPIISIVNPSKDTSINVLSLKIRFTYKDTLLKIDTLLDSTVNLIAGSNKVKAARSNGGGVGSDEVTILVDTIVPTVAITGPAAQNSGVAAISLAGAAGDLESGLQSINITGALAGNGFATLTAGDWSKGGMNLAEGLNTLVATALDKAGNSKTASITITLDSKKPGTPIVTAPAAVRAGPIKWTWAKANGDGSGKFKVKINAGPEIDATLAEYSLASLVEGTVYGLAVKETDPIAGDGPWSAEKQVLYDSKKPSPSISVTATPTKTPEWKWTSNGGVGTFRWHYKGQTVGSAGTGAGTGFAPTNLATGSHTLCVQEKDSPEWGEEWGTENCAILEVDKTGPVISNMLPISGFVTNKNSIVINYNADGIPGSFTCDLTLKADGTPTDCQKVLTDEFGNASTVKSTIWRRTKVVFVRNGAMGLGTSFDDAFGSLRQALSQKGSDQNQVWMLEGVYPMTGTPGPTPTSGTSIYGGFSDAKNQSSVTDRNLTMDHTILNSIGSEEDGSSPREILSIRNEDDSPISNITIDGVGISAGYYGILIYNVSNISLNNLNFNNSTAGGILHIEKSTATFNDCDFSQNSGAVMYISGNLVTINRCKFADNSTGAAAFSLNSGKVVVNNSVFQNSSGFSGFQYWIVADLSSPSTTLEMYNNTIQGYGQNPGPIVTSDLNPFNVIGSGNHP